MNMRDLLPADLMDQLPDAPASERATAVPADEPR